MQRLIMSHAEFETLYQNGIEGLLSRQKWFQLPPVGYEPLVNCPVCNIKPDGAVVKLRLPSYSHSVESGLKYNPPVCSRCANTNPQTLF